MTKRLDEAIPVDKITLEFMHPLTAQDKVAVVQWLQEKAIKDAEAGYAWPGNKFRTRIRAEIEGETYFDSMQIAVWENKEKP